MDIITLQIEIKIGSQIVESQTVQAPFQFLYQQCQDLVNTAANDSRPMKITMRGEKWLETPNGEEKPFPCSLIYANNAYTDNFDINE